MFLRPACRAVHVRPAPIVNGKRARGLVPRCPLHASLPPPTPHPPLCDDTPAADGCPALPLSVLPCGAGVHGRAWPEHRWAPGFAGLPEGAWWCLPPLLLAAGALLTNKHGGMQSLMDHPVVGAPCAPVSRRRRFVPHARLARPATKAARCPPAAAPPSPPRACAPPLVPRFTSSRAVRHRAPGRFSVPAGREPGRRPRLGHLRWVVPRRHDDRRRTHELSAGHGRQRAHEPPHPQLPPPQPAVLLACHRYTETKEGDFGARRGQCLRTHLTDCAPFS